MSKEKVEIELSANSAKLKSEFDAARARVNRFKKGVHSAVKSVGGLAAGVLGLAAGVRVIEDLRSKFDRIGKLANRFEMPVEEVQRLAVAADLSGASLEKLASSLVRGNTAAYDAQKGSKQLADAFADLGINAEEFAAAGETRKVEMLAAAYTGAADKATAMAAGTKILGRGFSELVPLLNEGSQGIRKMTDGLDLLNASEIAAIEKFNDDLSLLKANVQAGIAKEFAGEMENLAPTIIAVGEGLANVTQILTKHHRAIFGVVGAVGAYKAAKFSVAMAKDIATMLRMGTAMLATRAATEAETRAVVKNTTAHAANAVARKAADAAAMRSAGTRGGGAVAGAIGAEMAASGAATAGARKMGKKIGGSVIAGAIGAIATKSPQLALIIGAALGGYQLSSKLLGGNKDADEFAERFEKAFKNNTVHADALLATMHQMVTTAKTVEETTAARAKIAENIARLEDENQTLGEGQLKSANEHAIATLRIWSKSADIHRIRGQQLEVEKDISGEHEFQNAQQSFANKLAEEARVAAIKRKEAMAKAADAIRASIANLKAEIVGTQIDLLPPAKRVQVFTDQLRSGLKRAVEEFNFGRAGQGLETAGADSASLKGLYALAQKAAKEGNEGLAKSLLEQVADLQKVHAQITGAQSELGDTAKQAAQAELDIARERLAKEKEIAMEKQRQNAAKGALGEELAVLRLEAAGEMKKAAALQTQLRLRREAMEIAEATGISEEDALRIARQRENLKQRAEGIKAAPGGESAGEESGRKRPRLYNAQESLQRRLARQSKGIGSPGDMNSMDRRSTDLGQRFVRDAEASRSGPMSAVLQGNDAVPGKLDQIITLEEKMVKIFDNVIKV